MAGRWVIRQMALGGAKLYYRRNKRKSMLLLRWYVVRSPVEAKRFFRREQAESAAFAIVAAQPDLLGKLVVVEWDGNATSKP